MKEFRNKPKISARSRILAEKHEQKFFQQMAVPQVREVPAQASVTSSQSPPEFPAKVSSAPKMNIESMSFIAKKSTSPKKRTKSLLNLTVLERNETWLAEKHNKIGASRRMKEEEEMADCTFSPKTTSKSKENNKSVMRETNASVNISCLSTPLSVNTFDYSREYQMKNNLKDTMYRSIAPYQVKVAFKSGLDLQNFLKRAK